VVTKKVRGRVGGEEAIPLSFKDSCPPPPSSFKAGAYERVATQEKILVEQSDDLKNSKWVLRVSPAPFHGLVEGRNPA
jgi:hypothetical protein